MADDLDLADAIERGDEAAIAAYLAAVPGNAFSSTASPLCLSDRLPTRLMGFDAMAAKLAYGQAPGDAARIAEATVAVGLRHAEVDAGMVAGLAITLAEALRHAGGYARIVELAEKVAARLRGRDAEPSLGRLRLKAVDALIALRRLEEAETLMLEVERGGLDDPNLPMLRARLRALMPDGPGPRDRATPDEQAAADYKKGIGAALEALRRLTASTEPSLAAALGERRDRLGGEEALPATAREVHDRAGGMIDQISGLLGGGSPLLAWQSLLRRASSVFLDPARSHDPVHLAPALAEFEAARAWFDENQHRTDGDDARWHAYIALRRLGRFREAISVLNDLMRRLELDRAGIADPLRRAGLGGRFPLIFIAAAEVAEELDDPVGMLRAAEGAKGRTLADLLTHARGRPPDEAGLRGDASDAAALAARLGIHYLSFIIVADAAYAILVTRRGTWHRQRLPLDGAALVRLSRRLQPRAWAAIPGGAPFDLGAELAPLVAWLAPLVADGTVRPGEHIVYSPDENLHQLPLHLAMLDGESIGLRFGLSRVHGLDTLRGIAARAPLRPRRALVLFVPAAGEDDVARKRSAVQADLAPAEASVGVANWPDPRTIDSDMLARLAAPGALLHVVAHGIFPEEAISEGIDPNPYVSAGLMISRGGTLPERRAGWPARLTPRIVLESPGLDLDGAAVTLQGCVSGLAKTGVGGDALGLEWALLAKGAASVLATHWHVNYRSAGAFCRHFYAAWLGRGESRIAAWRAAAVATRLNAEGGSPHDWAAFSLTGDWR